MPVSYSDYSSGPDTRRNETTWDQWVESADKVGAGKDYSDLTKAALQQELEVRGLPKTGSKGDLIDRLRRDDA